jgi:pimeloyl-ACP methyl ester carboxylesterase
MTTRRTLLAESAAIAAGAVLPASAAHAATPAWSPKPTVVLVHGAFADASGWNAVAGQLLRDGYPVIAPSNPLRGVACDAAYLASVLATIGGPLLLVGHSYGGIVITNAAAANPNVTGLVYVAAFAPDQGETLQGLQTRYPGSRLNEAALNFRPYGDGLVDAYITREAFPAVFAGDLPKSVATVMWAGQRPADLRALGEPSGIPAWKSIPTWYLVARDDRVLPPAAQRFMAQRAGARVREVGASHVAMISQPAAAAGLITLAAR